MYVFDDLQPAISRLRRGQPPGNDLLIEELSAGINFITDFWHEKYLNEYIRFGGSKIKFLTGGKGSGKTHCMELFVRDAVKAGYVTATLSAKQTWVHDFKEIYTAVLAQVDLPSLLAKCAESIIKALGFDPKDVPDGITFTDYLSGLDLIDPMTKREMRSQLHNMFTQNRYIDNNFALCCGLLTGGILGHPVLEDQNRQLLLMWLSGSKEANLTLLKKLGLSPGRITKFNARHMLRSLVEVIKSAGYSGLVVCIDDMDALISSSGLDELRYTKLRREDAYESIRELIDEIDTLRNVMFIFGFDRKLMDEENTGLKSYQALWMRIQNEIAGERFNRFADIVDLDTLARQEYDAGVLTEMSRRLASVFNKTEQQLIPINEQAAENLLSEFQYGQISLPLRVNRMTLGRDCND